MAVSLISPGLLTREIDLTVGRADNVSTVSGAIAGPFQRGPVDQVITISNEQNLLDTFGEPVSTDAQYEYWLSASSFLTYGGSLKVIRTSGSTLKNANAGVGIASTSLLIKNYDDYKLNYDTTNTFYFASRNPGTWANNLKVCVIDDVADQIVAISTTSPAGLGVTVGYGVTYTLTDAVIPGAGTTSTFNGYLKAIITGVTTDSTNGNSSFTVKIDSIVSTTGTETKVGYQENGVYAIPSNATVSFVDNTGVVVTSSQSVGAVSDWYSQQTLGLTNSTVYWKSIAPKPSTNDYSAQRNGKNDSLHVVVVDDLGTVSGVSGNIIEKHLNLSKSLDSVASNNAPTKIWYKNYINDFSANIHAGAALVGVTTASSTYDRTAVVTGFTTGFNKVSNGTWGQNAQGITFNAVGNITYSLTNGVDYSASGGYAATLGDLSISYDLFSVDTETEIDYLIGGPGLSTKQESQAKANKLISIAESRKDCVAVISPWRSAVVNLTNTTTQTNNILEFFAPLTSSSYAFFDSGYKYTYDRFSNEFRYIPCSGDIAGLMSRLSINAFPWFSPAGVQRGVLNNTIKLAYNPSKEQRDSLYSARINPVVFQPGTGFILYGDKTALSYQSSFDRINVRKLFIEIEKTLETAANAQLFEINDAATRSAFVSVAEPYLRSVQANRGIFDFRVICDETNNTPDVVDNNEFRANIFIKPTRSINYITLTFVATRTGVSFEEVAGSV
jgi:hypothetical protein